MRSFSSVVRIHSKYAFSNFRRRRAKYRDCLFRPYKYDSLLIVSAVNGWTVCTSPRLDFSVTAGQSSVPVKCPLLCDDSSLWHIVQSQCRPHGYVQQFTPEAEVYASTLQLAVGDLDTLATLFIRGERTDQLRQLSVNISLIYSFGPIYKMYKEKGNPVWLKGSEASGHTNVGFTLFRCSNLPVN